MIYQYDQALQLPTVDLYDTLLMAMALNAAKDMYDKGELQIKDFLKAYGDFMTPIISDQDWYNRNVTGKVRDIINNIYARGGDPLRNAQDRALISMLINSMPYGDIAKLKSSAKAAEEYIKNRGILEAAGKYNADLEERYLGYNLNGWDTMNNGVWNRTSPTEMKTLKELTESWYNNRTARDLTKEDLLNSGIPYDPRYKYSGYLDSDILNVARGQTPGWNDTVYSNYYRDLAKLLLQRAGVENPTNAQIESVLLRNIADANQEFLINPTKTADEFAKMAQQHAYNKQLEAIKHANEMDEITAKGQLKLQDESGNYMHLISNATSGARNAFSSQTFSEFAARHPKEAAANLNEVANLQLSLLTEKDPNKIKHIKERMQILSKKMQRLSMQAFLTRKNEDGLTTPYSILMSLGEGQAGVYAINDILKNRSIGGDVELDDDLVLSRSGYNAPDEKGWSSPKATAGRILSPHQIMTNILKHESGSGVRLKTKDGKIVTQDDIIKRIGESAENEGFWEASTNARLSRTDKILSLHEYISAPDEKGNYHVYMKVAILQGARLLQPGSWLPQGEHNGFWVETNIKQLPDGTLSTESNPAVFGAGLRLRKDFTNAASNEEYNSIRW